MVHPEREDSMNQKEEATLVAAILKVKPTASMPKPGAQPAKPKRRKKRSK